MRTIGRSQAQACRYIHNSILAQFLRLHILRGPLSTLHSLGEVLGGPVRAIRGVPCRAARCRTDASEFRRTNPKRTTAVWAKEVLNRRLVAGDVEFFKVAVEGNDLDVVFTSTGDEEGVRASDVDRLQTFESRKHLTGVAELYAVLLK